MSSALAGYILVLNVNVPSILIVFDFAGETEKLETAVAAAAAKDDCVLSMAKSYREDVIPVMDDLRAAVDALEVITPSEKWPVPAYSDIIFNV